MVLFIVILQTLSQTLNFCNLDFKIHVINYYPQSLIEELGCYTSCVGKLATQDPLSSS